MTKELLRALIDVAGDDLTRHRLEMQLDQASKNAVTVVPISKIARDRKGQHTKLYVSKEAS